MNEEEIIRKEYRKMFKRLFIIGVLPLIIIAIIIVIWPSLSNLSYLIISTILGSLHTQGEAAAVWTASTWSIWYIVTYLEQPQIQFLREMGFFIFGLILGLGYTFNIAISISRRKRIRNGALGKSKLLFLLTQQLITSSRHVRYQLFKFLKQRI